MSGWNTARNLFVVLAASVCFASSAIAQIQAGVSEVDITPPDGFPMAGYYHERLATGAIDPLKAKAIVFQQGGQSAALVVCDLIGVSTDLSKAIRTRAAKRTGIPRENIVVSASFASPWRMSS